jgi:hypothetical protein
MSEDADATIRARCEAPAMAVLQGLLAKIDCTSGGAVRKVGRFRTGERRSWRFGEMNLTNRQTQTTPLARFGRATSV